ncbi:MAG: type I-U CRISPR-associated protein Csb2 [Myxococcota bacterium]
MFAIHLECLTGRYASQSYDDRSRAEWPPHPARLFSALVATWAETDGDVEERAALQFLETCAPPQIAAEGPAVPRRRVVPVFVPVNDVTVLTEISLDKLEAAERAVAEVVDAKARAKAETALAKASELHAKRCADVVAPGKVSAEAMKTAMAVLPDRRVRQPRTFPSVGPADPHVAFVFAEDPVGHRAPLDRLCRRLVRVGHSASLVAARVDEAPTEAGWVPDDDGDTVLRWVDQGQLERMDDAFARHGGVEPRVLPCRFVSYRYGEADKVGRVQGSLFADDPVVLVFARSDDRRQLAITLASEVANAVRGALMAHGDQPSSAIVTGHRLDHGPADEPHLAIVPLPFVGTQYADGHLMGVGLFLPRSASDTDRGGVYRAVARWMAQGGELVLGRAGKWTLAVDEDGRAEALRPDTWCKPSAQWASVTPVALDRNPGDLLGGGAAQQAAHREAEAIVATACERIGLPRPAQVEVSFRPPWTGSAKVDRNHPPYPVATGRIRRVQVHVRLRFDQPVRGPVLLGAGRYRGLGLLRPVQETP